MFDHKNVLLYIVTFGFWPVSMHCAPDCWRYLDMPRHASWLHAEEVWPTVILRHSWMLCQFYFNCSFPHFYFLYLLKWYKFNGYLNLTCSNFENHNFFIILTKNHWNYECDNVPKCDILQNLKTILQTLNCSHFKVHTVEVKQISICKNCKFTTFP